MATDLLTHLIAVGLIGSASACAQPNCDCPIIPSAITFEVQSGADGQPVAAPMFSEGGTALHADCDALGSVDAGTPCSAWTIAIEGHHVIKIDAAGFQSQSVPIDLAPPAGGCCPRGQQVTRTVALAPS